MLLLGGAPLQNGSFQSCPLKTHTHTQGVSFPLIGNLQGEPHVYFTRSIHTIPIYSQRLPNWWFGASRFGGVSGWFHIYPQQEIEVQNAKPPLQTTNYLSSQLKPSFRPRLFSATIHRAAGIPKKGWPCLDGRLHFLSKPIQWELGPADNPNNWWAHPCLYLCSQHQMEGWCLLFDVAGVSLRNTVFAQLPKRPLISTTLPWFSLSPSPSLPPSLPPSLHSSLPPSLPPFHP